MKNITYLRFLFFTIIVVVHSLLIAYSIPASAIHTMNSTPSQQGATEKHGEMQTDSDEPNLTAQESTTVKASSLQNGLSILESRCAQCHTPQWLKKTKKTQTEWEITLAQMERIGVHLSDTEKDILIDYLVYHVEP